MAYEAMNNAGALHQRLVVILNDNDMSIAPPVGAMSAYLSRLMSSRSLPVAARAGGEDGAPVPRRDRAHGAQGRGVCPRHPDRRHAVRGARLLLRRARSTATTWTTCCRCCATCATPRIAGRSCCTSSPARAGYAPAEASADKYHAVNRFNVITGAQLKGEPKPGQVVPPAYTKVFADSLIQEGRGRSAGRRGDRGDAVRHRARQASRARRVPRPLLRCRHRRAARGDVRRRHGDGRDEAVLRDLLDLPAACLRPGRARRGDPAPAGAVRDRPRGPGGRRRGDPCRQLRPRLSRLPARDGADGAVGRGGAEAHGGDGGRRSTTGRARCAIRVARAPAWCCRRAARCWRSAAGGSSARGQQRRDPVARHAPGRCAAGGGRAGGAGPVDHGGGCTVRQAARHGG